MREPSPESQAFCGDSEMSEMKIPLAERIILKMMEGVRGATIISSNAWDTAVEDDDLMAHYSNMRAEGKLDEPEKLERPIYLNKDSK